MVEANHSVHRVTLRARLAQATINLARQQAEKAVKLALKRQGKKPQYMPKREIVALTRHYLASHPELFADAKPVVEQWRREGFFGKRAARVERNSQYLHEVQRAGPWALTLRQTHVRNGIAKTIDKHLAEFSNDTRR